jgi:hypothetical protein
MEATLTLVDVRCLPDVPMTVFPRNPPHCTVAVR